MANAKLSKNVLQMKFMQRSVLRMEEEQNEEEKQRVIDDEHWVLDLPQLTQREEKFIVEPSFSACENLLFGRMSFKQFNPEVEKLMKIHNGSREATEGEQETVVSATEMANRYSALVGIISKKFASKRKRKEMMGKEAEDEDPDVDMGEEDSDEDQIVNVPPKLRKKFLKPADD